MNDNLLSASKNCRLPTEDCGLVIQKRILEIDEK